MAYGQVDPAAPGRGARTAIRNDPSPPAQRLPISRGRVVAFPRGLSYSLDPRRPFPPAMPLFLPPPALPTGRAKRPAGRALAIQPPPHKPPRRVNPRRPVFLRGAISRLLRQPARLRPRAVRHTLSAVLATASWWLRTGLPQLAPTLVALRHRRATLALRPPSATPSVDVYAPAAHAAYLSARLSTPPAAHAPPPTTPVVVYVHGGAWGSGAASQYAQLAHALVRHTGATVLVVSYRLYPSALIAHQHADVADALRLARRLFPNRPLALLAHSSGAHLAALALVRAPQPARGHSPLADVLVATAAPFHLMHHFLFEARRGVAEVSPMLPAADAEEDPDQFLRNSPTHVLERAQCMLHEVPGLPPRPRVLEGQLPATNVWLPPVKAGERGVSFPRTYVVTSSCDTVVPCHSSIRFAATLRECGLESELLVYDGMEHVEFVTDWFGGGERDRSAVFDVDEADRERRRTYRTILHGKAMAEVAEVGEAEGQGSAYVRDVVRILNGLVGKKEEDNEKGQKESEEREESRQSGESGESDPDEAV